MTLAFEFDLNRVKVYQHAKYLGQRSFSSKVFVRTQTHARAPDSRLNSFYSKIVF